VMGFHLANFGLPIGLSFHELGRGTRQTDRQTDTAHHFIMPSPYGRRRNNRKTTNMLNKVNIVAFSLQLQKTFEKSIVRVVDLL